MIQKIIICTLLITTSYADFNGRWSGEGFAKTASASSPCEKVYFRLSLSQEKFKIQDGGYNCSGLSAEYPYSVFTIQGNDLIYKGEISGRISDNEIEIFSIEDGFQLLFTKIDNQTIKVEERWQDGDDFLVINSSLELIK